jgi:hypothetical protein
MQTDPFEARRRGLHRLRLVTASIGAAAAVGTGAIAWSVASQTASASAVDGVSTESGSTSSTNQFLQPSQPPGNAGGGGVHASSGGS